MGFNPKKSSNPTKKIPPKKISTPNIIIPFNGHFFRSTSPVRNAKKTAFPTDINPPSKPPRWTTRAMASWFVASTNVTIRRSSTRPGENDFRSKKIFFSREFWELSGWQPVFPTHFFWMKFIIHIDTRVHIDTRAYIYICMLYHYYISSLRWILSNWDDISQMEQTSFGWSVYRLLKHIGSIWTYLEDP